MYWLAAIKSPKSVMFPVSVGEGAVVVDGSGRTLMPGLIDAHSHIAVNASPTEMESSMDLADAGIRMTLKANNYLMDGFYCH